MVLAPFRVPQMAIAPVTGEPVLKTVFVPQMAIVRKDVELTQTCVLSSTIYAFPLAASRNTVGDCVPALATPVAANAPMMSR